MTNNKRYIIREYYELCEGGVCQDFLNEEDKRLVKGGTMLLTGKLQCANRKNQNGRIYKKETLAREMNNYQSLIRERRSVGECNHPAESVDIDLKNISHVVREVWWRGDELWGKIEILEKMPSGQILKSLVESNIPIGISSRALGSLKETSEGSLVNDEDFQFICFDAVQNPSVYGSFLSLQESKKFTSNIFTKKDRLWRILNDITGYK